MDAAQSPSTRWFGGDGWASVRRNLGWMLASKGVLAVLSLIYLGIVARTLGVTGFGRFALITGAAQALATLVAFQTWQVIVQFGVGAAQAGDEAKLARLFRSSLLLDLASALVGALLATLILELWSEALGISPTLKRATLIFAIIQVVTSRSAALGILRLRDRFSLAAIADSTTPVARLIGAVAVLLIHPTVQGFLVAWAVAEILTAAAYWGMVARIGDLKLLRQGRGLRQLLADHPGFFRFALSTNASSTLGLASKQIPLLVVGGQLGVAAAGTFRLAAQLAQALAKIGQLLSRAAFPEIVKAVRDAHDAAVRRLLWRTVMGSALVGVVIMLLAVLIGGPVLKLVGGKAFAGGSSVLIWMAAAGCVDLVAVGLDTVMTARGHAGRVFLVRIVGAAVMVATAVFTLPQMGEVGMAVAVLAGSVVVTLLLALAGTRRNDAHPPPDQRTA